MNTIISMIKPKAQDSKPKEFLCLFLLLAMSILGAAAQQKNRLYLQDINAIKDHDVSLPVFLENTNQDIVAIQFDLSIASNNIYLIEESAVLSKDRCDDHTLKVVYQGYNKYKLTYTFMLISPTNKPIKANGGEVFSIPVQIPDDIEEEKPFALTLSNVVLSDSKCTNVATGSGDANLTVNPTPDFEVSDILAHASSFMPGEQMQVSWKVNNIGNADAKGGWRERIWLVSADGYQVNINTSYYDTQSMAQGSTVNRSADITLPNAIGLDGAANIKVELTPNNDSGESYSMKSNNTVQTTDYPVTIGKKLFLLLPDTIAEDAGQVCCELIRSGSKKSGYAFRLEKTGDDRLEIPATVNLPSGQSSAWFYVNTKDNQLTDANSVFTITVTGDGYEAETARMVIADNDHPDLSIKVSKSEVTEGETFQLTVSVSDASHQNPITVSLACEGSKRFSFAKQVVIPVGQTSVTVDVTATDNEEVEQQQSYAFYASAEGYLDSECLVLLNDNDMPQLTFTLSPSAVSEAEGATALLGIIKRTDKLDKRVIFKLSDDNEGLLSYPTNTIVLEKNRSEVQFNIGVNENSSDNGTRQVNVTASAYSSSCDCLVNSLSGNALTATVTIIDANGPALSVKSAGTTMQEGSKGNVLTISHNAAAANKDITVTISSDKDDRLSYNHTVTIPAGATSADVLIDVNKNDSEDDSEIVTFRVEADGYAMGTCWLIVTDQSLPDATISIQASKQETEAEGAVELKIIVKNEGNAKMRAYIPVKLAFSGRDKTVTLTTTEVVAPGGSTTIDYNYDLPAVTGNYYFTATVNPSHALPELIYANNTSEQVPITLLSRFSATATAEKKSYKQGETVSITGSATGSFSKNTNVEIFFINENVRQSITTKIDADGHFSATWQPYDMQSGHFIVGACYPGSNMTEGSDAFDIYGLSIPASYDTYELANAETYSGKLTITNPGQVRQTGLKVETKGQSDNCTFSFNSPNSIEAGQTIELPFTIKSNAVSSGKDWQKMPVEITTDEGAKLNYQFFYFVYPQKAQLEVSETSINTTMALGTPRDYPLTIRNSGRAETGKITLALPDWIQTVTPREMGSLAQGDSATIMLRFMPTAEMKLNVKITGSLGINCDNSDGVKIDFTLTPVSEKTGKLTIDVVDEFTFYTDSKPHVGNAKVEFVNPATNEVVAKGETGADGTFTAELTEGYYTVKVEAEKHDGYINTLIVDPGKDKQQEVFLPYQAITYSWNVKETEIDDEYEIETVLKYETRVPKPIIELELPNEAPVPNCIFIIKVKNTGLISTDDVTVTVGSNSGYSLEFLHDAHWAELKPQEEKVVPVRMKPIYDINGYPLFKSECIQLWARVIHKDKCDKYGYWTETTVERGWGSCNKKKGSGSSSSSSGKDSIGGASIGRPSAWGDYQTVTSSYNTTLSSPTKSCDGKPTNNGNGNGGNGSEGGNGGHDGKPDSPSYDPDYPPLLNPCDATNMKEMLKCGANLATCWIPGVGCAVGLATSCGSVVKTWLSGFKERTSLASGLGCGLSVLGCIPGASCMLAAAGCATSGPEINEACKGYPGFEKARAANNEAVNIIDDYFTKLEVTNDEVKALIGYIAELYGADDWFAADPGELSELLDYLHSIDNEAPVQVDEKLLMLKPSNISNDQFNYFIERFNNTTLGYDSNYAGMDNYIHIENLQKHLDTIDASEAYAKQAGYPATQEMMQEAYGKFVKYIDEVAPYLSQTDDEEESNSICSTVTLSFKQASVMTRQAFRGTLTVENGNEAEALKDFKVYLEVRDKDGKLATTHEFQIDTEELNGFEGELNTDAGWILAAKGIGEATFLFIPTKYAAPTEPQDYSFGGSFSYTDPATGLTVTRDLNPVTLTVNPSPQLELTYFMQRDVIGDDPLTEEVESMEPAEFALLINNKGYGEATNMSLTTQQPQIIDNQKGLAINFQLLSSQLNGQEKTLALGGSMTTDFGTIPAQSQAYAQWWLQSSLLGHFIEYNVNTTHVTSRDNPDLSLLDNVSIHELIHGFTAGNGLRGFLVNDQTDAEDLPDRVYLTDATQHDVSMAATMNISQQNETEWLLTVTPSQAGWNYGVISDPTNSKLKVVKIVRQSDGAELDADNVWLTDRTLRDGKDPLCENRLHFVGNLGAQGDSYLLTFAEKTDTELSIKDLKSVLASDTDNPLGIIISPIPVYDQMHISGDFNLLQQIAIYDMGGIVRLRTGKLLPGQPIDVTKLPAGLYAVNIVTDRGTYQTKILKK